MGAVPEPLKATATGSPRHTDWSGGSSVRGVGLTVMVNVTGSPVQVTEPVASTLT